MTLKEALRELNEREVGDAYGNDEWVAEWVSDGKKVWQTPHPSIREVPVDFSVEEAIKMAEEILWRNQMERGEK